MTNGIASKEAPSGGQGDASVDIDLAVRTLQLFNEKTAKLQRLRFTQYMLEHGKISFTISGQQTDEGFVNTIERHGPDEEMIDAVVLTLRFFIQNNEPISLCNMGKLYDKLPVRSELVEQYRDARRKINELLDSETYLNLYGKQITLRDMQDIIIYGDLSHVKPKKRAVYESWMQHAIVPPMIFNEFCALLYSFIGLLCRIGRINLAAIRELEHAPGT